MPSSQRAVNYQLPAEILLMTFEYLAPEMLNGSPHRPDELVVFYSVLCSSAHVCRAWRNPAQELLFRYVAPRAGRVDVHTEPTVRRRLLRAKRFDAVKQAEDDRRYEELAGLRARTTSVALRLGNALDSRVLFPLTAAQHLSWDQFVGMVQAFPNIQTLVLHSHILDIFSPNPTDKQFRMLHTHRHLKNLAVYAHAQSPQWLPMLLSAWSATLESVEIAVRQSQTMCDLDLDVLGVGMPCLLPKLRRFSVMTSLAGCSKWLQTTLRGCNLTHLRCRPTDLPELMSIVKATLVDLTVDPTDSTVTMSGFRGPFPDLGSCCALRAARLRRHVVLEQLRTLPEGVEELCAIASPTCLRRFVEERPAIRHITLVEQSYQSPQGILRGDNDHKIGIERLRAECSRRGIKFEPLPEATVFPPLPAFG